MTLRRSLSEGSVADIRDKGAAEEGGVIEGAGGTCLTAGRTSDSLLFHCMVAISRYQSEPFVLEIVVLGTAWAEVPLATTCSVFAERAAPISRFSALPTSQRADSSRMVLV